MFGSEIGSRRYYKFILIEGSFITGLGRLPVGWEEIDL